MCQGILFKSPSLYQNILFLLLKSSYRFFVYIIRESLKKSALWQILDKHYEEFERNYSEKFEKQYRFFRSVINEVVRAYLRCGDLKNGFVGVRCPKRGHEYSLQFSCKVRCFCPSCQAKQVVLFGHHLKENVFYPVPYRQYVFTRLC